MYLLRSPRERSTLSVSNKVASRLGFRTSSDTTALSSFSACPALHTTALVYFPQARAVSVRTSPSFPFPVA